MISYNEHLEGDLLASNETFHGLDKGTKQHATKVQEICLGLADELGIKDKPSIDKLSAASILHDIGKIEIPVEILFKNGPLDEQERKLMETHTSKGYELCKKFGVDDDVAYIVKHHHEKNDGSGYPSSLKENEIGYLCKIVSVADIFEALSSKRPYKDSKPLDEVKRILDIELSKNRLDSTIMKALYKMADRNLSKRIRSLRESFRAKFPPIKYVSNKTVELIDLLNQDVGKKLTVTEIMNMYKDLKKDLDLGITKLPQNERSLLKDRFNRLEEILSDVKNSIQKEYIMSVVRPSNNKALLCGNRMTGPPSSVKSILSHQGINIVDALTPESISILNSLNKSKVETISFQQINDLYKQMKNKLSSPEIRGEEKNRIHGNLQKLDYVLNDYKKVQEDLDRIKDAENQTLSVTNQNHNGEKFKKDLLTHIKDIYKVEYPAIQYISKNSAEIINSLNKKHGKINTIKEIKSMYKEVKEAFMDKKLENNPEKGIEEKFNKMHSLYNDLRKSRSIELDESAKGNKKGRDKNKNKEHTI